MTFCHFTRDSLHDFRYLESTFGIEFIFFLWLLSINSDLNVCVCVFSSFWSCQNLKDQFFLTPPSPFNIFYQVRALRPSSAFFCPHTAHCSHASDYSQFSGRCSLVNDHFCACVTFSSFFWIIIFFFLNFVLSLFDLDQLFNQFYPFQMIFCAFVISDVYFFCIVHQLFVLGFINKREISEATHKSFCFFCLPAWSSRLND